MTTTTEGPDQIHIRSSSAQPTSPPPWATPSAHKDGGALRAEPTQMTALRSSAPLKALHFPADRGFQQALLRRVNDYFASVAPRRAQGDAGLHLKTALILGASASCYALLLVSSRWWQAVPLAVALGFLAALIGFNIQHDGGHRAYSPVPWRNRLAAATLDLIGGSSYLWHWKHAVFHHGRANVSGHDTDISVGRLVRLEPQQRREFFHRWQFIYIWALYGLMTVRWQCYDDFREVIGGAIGPHRIPRPRGIELTIFAVGKLLFIGLAFGVPLLFQPPWCVLLGYLIASATLGITLAVVFQLAHNTALVEFPAAPAASGLMPHSWAEHQVLTAADFSRSNSVLTWLLGGLNFQIEHHLLPHISHVHYPALSPLVEATCREHGLPYREHRSLASGLAAHVAWLRHLGRG
jgi:linoleoyl-CoA desaturase